MSTLYGTSVGGLTQWDDVGSWFTDSGLSTPALATPTDADLVYTDGSFTTGPAIPVHLALLDNLTLGGTGPDALDYSSVTADSWNFGLAGAAKNAVTATSTFTGSGTRFMGTAAGASTILTFDTAATNTATGVANATVIFTNQSFNKTQSYLFTGAAKVQFDTGSLAATSNVSGGYVPNSVPISWDGGTTWTIPTALLPDAAHTLNTASTYDSSGNPVAGTDIGSVAGAAARLSTDRGIVTGQAANIIVGTNLGALGNPVGSHATTATIQAAQLAADYAKMQVLAANTIVLGSTGKWIDASGNQVTVNGSDPSGGGSTDGSLIL
jgi:hypothetical protein